MWQLEQPPLLPPRQPPPSRYEMPDPRLATPDDDVVAVGADLRPGTLLAAYTAGLFPMPIDPNRRRSDIAWFSPDPRGIIPLDGLRVTRSLRRSTAKFHVTRDTAFSDVVEACAAPDRTGRWITTAITEAYHELHERGYAHSVEVWSDGKLVGGLYGVRVARLFAGESMFHTATDASKVALVALVEWLQSIGVILLDVQWTTPHLESLGAVSIPRLEYLDRLVDAVR